MEITLYDHRTKYGFGITQCLGSTKILTMTKGGSLRIRNTDLLYSLKIQLSLPEMESLYSRLGDIIDYHNAKKKRKSIIDIANQIIKEKPSSET